MPIKESFRLNDGTVMPWLAIGSGTALYNQDVSHPISQVIRAGITHLDGAQVYLNEQSLGAGILSSGVSRDKLYVTTKLDVVPQGKTVVDTLKESLERLQLSTFSCSRLNLPILPTS
jgi:diketogulonate reductase-like aldo/keto reductase